MNVKARIQGNSITLTLPKSFNVEVGTMFEPIKTDEGILFKFAKEAEDPWDFDIEILSSVIADGFEGNDIIVEFEKRKKKMPDIIDSYFDKLSKEAEENAITVSREDF